MRGALVATTLLLLLAGCGVDGAPEPPQDARWPDGGIDSSAAGGVGGASSSPYGAGTEL